MASVLPSRWWLALEIIARLKRSNHRAGIATIYAGLGDKDHAFEWLEEAYQSGEWLLTTKVNPEFDALRADPRFAVFLKKIGLEP